MIDAHDLARRRDRLGGVQLARDAELRLEHGRDGDVMATSVMDGHASGRSFHVKQDEEEVSKFRL